MQEQLTEAESLVICNVDTPVIVVLLETIIGLLSYSSLARFLSRYDNAGTLSRDIEKKAFNIIRGWWNLCQCYQITIAVLHSICHLGTSRMASTSPHKDIYINPAARFWQHSLNLDSRIIALHQSLPGFAPTPLISVESIAKEIGVKHVFVKQESSRAGLPAFKILGASWATYRSIARTVNRPIGVSLDDLGVAASNKGIKLFAATDGNHGRAVARMAKLLGLESDIFVPAILDRPTQDLITSEGARVVIIDGDYDYTVQQARFSSEVPGGLLIQDTAFEGYTEIAQVHSNPMRFSFAKLSIRSHHTN